MTQREIYEWGRTIHQEVAHGGASELGVGLLVAEIVRQVRAERPECEADAAADECEICDPIAHVLGSMPPGTVITIEVPK